MLYNLVDAPAVRTLFEIPLLFGEVFCFADEFFFGAGEVIQQKFAVGLSPNGNGNGFFASGLGLGRRIKANNKCDD